MRVEAAAGQQSQPIEQLRALVANVPRQATTKPTDDPPREVATPRSIRPAAESLEEKLNLQQSKLLNDVYKLADVSAKFSAPQTDFADFLAQKAAELTQLSNRLAADDARFAKEFSNGVHGLREQYAEDGANIADATATFEDDDRNIQDTRANNEADAAEVGKFRQKFLQDSANVQAFQEDFGEDRQNVKEFNKNFREDRTNIQAFQANFVEDRQNIGDFQRNFVEDRTNVEKSQGTFVEDKTNMAAFRRTYQEDVQEIGRRQRNFDEDKNTMLRFSEKYGNELAKFSGFRGAYDREVDSIERLQSAADLQKSILSERSAPTVAQQTKPDNVPSDARAFAGEFGSKAPSVSRHGLSLAEMTPQRAQRTEPNTPTQAPVGEPLNGNSPATVSSRPLSPQVGRPVGPTVSERPMQMPLKSTASQATAVPLSMNPPNNSFSDAAVDSLPRDPRVTTPTIADQQNSRLLPTSSLTARQPAPIWQPSQYEPDVFQLAGILAMQMATSAPAQTSVNRSAVAAAHGSRAGDLKSGFSFLAHTAKKDERGKHAEDEDEEDRR